MLVKHKLTSNGICFKHKTLETIYETFIRSKLEYACIVWDDCSDQDSKAIEDYQLRAARIVTGAKKGTSHDKLYYETQWSKEERRFDFKLCFMHKVVHKNAPEYLVELLPNTVGAITSYNLRNKDDFAQFDLHSEKFRKSLLPDCVRKWNSLDKQERNEGSYHTFKKNIANPLKCLSLFYIGIRKFNVIHAQLRLNCSNLNAHVHSLHPSRVISEYVNSYIPTHTPEEH